jgi:hypothetical protein
MQTLLGATALDLVDVRASGACPTSLNQLGRPRRRHRRARQATNRSGRNADNQGSHSTRRPGGPPIGWVLSGSSVRRLRGFLHGCFSKNTRCLHGQFCFPAAGSNRRRARRRLLPGYAQGRGAHARHSDCPSRDFIWKPILCVTLESSNSVRSRRYLPCR